MVVQWLHWRFGSIPAVVCVSAGDGKLGGNGGDSVAGREMKPRKPCRAGVTWSIALVVFLLV